MPLRGPKSRGPEPLKGEPRKGRTKTPVEVTRRTTVEKFVQGTSDRRAWTEAVDRLHDRLQEVATAVVKKATQTAKADGRKTLFDQDIDRAFDTLSGIPGQGLTPEVLLDLIDRLETVKIATALQYAQGCVETGNTEGRLTMRILYFRCNSGHIFRETHCPLDGWTHPDFVLARAVADSEGNETLSIHELRHAGVTDSTLMRVMIIEFGSDTCAFDALVPDRYLIDGQLRRLTELRGESADRFL